MSGSNAQAGWYEPVSQIQNQDNNSSRIRTHQKMNKYYDLPTDDWKLTCKLLPNYKTLSSHDFKRLLCKTIQTDHYQIQQWLANTEMLQFSQQLAVLMCTSFQLKIEEEYWYYIGNLNMPVVTWLSEVSKDVIEKNSINWDHSKIKLNIRYQQNLIRNKLQRLEINLYNYLQRYSSNLKMNDDKMSFEQWMNIICNALVVLMQNDLHHFNTNFEQKKILFTYDINDANRVKPFYDLNPIEKQVYSTQQIWRSKLRACEKVISQQNKRWSRSNQVIVKGIIPGNHSIINMKQNEFDNYGNDQENRLLSMKCFSPSMRAIIQARLDNIEQRAQQIIKFIHASSQ
ncbi:unnamed protein product [Rotaria sordida]|uniref:Uncharacterized protein n=1 Tax=Rotaria sordida TaxID=392033 RepID=A0A815V2A3_9BILA|nr:unnamed protein product [Rotaria sordida]CAF1664086.1 unnamed protein product [Rotaria sordida]